MIDGDELLKRLRDVRDDPPYVMCEGVEMTDFDAIEVTCLRAADHIEFLRQELFHWHREAVRLREALEYAARACQEDDWDEAYAIVGSALETPL